MAQLTLKVKKQAFKNLQTKQAGYISRVISNGVASFDDLCKIAATNTTLHPKELALAFGLALDAVQEALKQGMIVDLDQIGRIYPSVSSKWTEKADDQKLENLTLDVTYRPSQTVKAAIAGAKLAWATDKEAADADKNGTTTDGGTTTDTGSSSGTLTDDGQGVEN